MRSVLKTFFLFMLQFGQIKQKFHFDDHSYADDTQLYLAVSRDDPI